MRARRPVGAFGSEYRPLARKLRIPHPVHFENRCLAAAQALRRLARAPVGGLGRPRE